VVQQLGQDRVAVAVCLDLYVDVASCDYLAALAAVLKQDSMSVKWEQHVCER